MPKKRIFTTDEIKLIGKLYKNPEITISEIAKKLKRKSKSGINKVISQNFKNLSITKKRLSVSGKKRKGLDTGKKGREIYSKKLESVRKSIFFRNKQECSRCKKTKELKEFGRLPKNQQRIKGIVLYVSHCNLCDAKRTAKYKSKKSSTIEGMSQFLMSNVYRRKREKNLKVDINHSWIIKRWHEQNKRCFYTGLKMDLSTKRKFKLIGGGYKKNNKYVVSIDRLDPNKGYIKSNCVLCTWFANNMKQDLSLKDFIKFSKLISVYRSKSL